MQRTRLIIFVKRPAPGRVKTRLIPALGALGAAQLAEQMLHYTCQQAELAMQLEPSLDCELCVDPDPDDPIWAPLMRHPRWRLTQQCGGDLGARMCEAAMRAAANNERVLLIGTDCPGLNASRFIAAANALEHYDAALHPTLDGGYALLGLNRVEPGLFEQIPWSTPQVASSTLDKLTQLNFSVLPLAQLQDVDEPGELAIVPAAWLNTLTNNSNIRSEE